METKLNKTEKFRLFLDYIDRSIVDIAVVLISPTVYMKLLRVMDPHSFVA